MFPLWFALLGGGSFVFLDVWVLPFCSLFPPTFFLGCFGLFMIGRVSSFSVSFSVSVSGAV
jgi:hypothetical protein